MPNTILDPLRLFLPHLPQTENHDQIKHKHSSSFKVYLPPFVGGLRDGGLQASSSEIRHRKLNAVDIHMLTVLLHEWQAHVLNQFHNICDMCHIITKSQKHLATRDCCEATYAKIFAELNSMRNTSTLKHLNVVKGCTNFKCGNFWLAK